MSLAGLFVEPRRLKQVVLNIVNFQRCLPKKKLYFYCGKDNKKYHEAEMYAYNERNDVKINISDIQIIELDTTNLNFETYSNLLKNKDIWETIEADYVLTIQTDGCLCEKSPFKIEDFFKYDYVGGYTPNNHWREIKKMKTKPPGNFWCCNGGFSLRNRKRCLQVIDHFKTSKTERYHNKCPVENYAEDLYFVVGMLHLGYNVGFDEFATQFCSHTHFKKGSFCIHKLDNYASKKVVSLSLEYCEVYRNFLVKHKDLA